MAMNNIGMIDVERTKTKKKSKFFNTRPQKSSDLVLGYWKCRGAAQYLRYLMEFLDLGYEDKLYTNAEKQLWFEQDKLNLKSNFPNLPYLEDGDKVITETTAIEAYLIQKANRLFLLGLDEPQRHVDILQLRGALKDLHKSITSSMAKGPEQQQNIKKAYDENFLPGLSTMEKYLGDKDYLVDNEISICDFMFFEQLQFYEKLWPDCLTGFPKVKAFTERIKEIPQIKAYLASERMQQYFIGETAGF